MRWWLLTILIVPASCAPYDGRQNVEGPTAEVWPKGLELGQVSGIDTDVNGNVHVFHRGSRTWNQDSFDFDGNFKQRSFGPIKEDTHLLLGRNGRVLARHGKDRFYMPHGLHVDRKNNVWLTDVALHQVFKFAPGEEEPELVLGEAFVKGSDSKHFCQPTGVATARNGDFFVSDGYCNARIMKFSKNGTFITSWGRASSKFPAEPGTFRVPHSLTLIEDWDLLCVADRENMRIQCFSAGLNPRRAAGILVKQPAEGLGRVFAVANQDHYLVGVTNQAMAGPEGQESELFLVDMETGASEVIKPGLENPHDLAVSPEGTIYVGEIGPNEIKRIRMQDH